jgi:hypothetical protein
MGKVLEPAARAGALFLTLRDGRRFVIQADEVKTTIGKRVESIAVIVSGKNTCQGYPWNWHARRATPAQALKHVADTSEPTTAPVEREHGSGIRWVCRAADLEHCADQGELWLATSGIPITLRIEVPGEDMEGFPLAIVRILRRAPERLSNLTIALGEPGIAPGLYIGERRYTSWPDLQRDVDIQNRPAR